MIKEIKDELISKDYVTATTYKSLNEKVSILKNEDYHPHYLFNKNDIFYIPLKGHKTQNQILKEIDTHIIIEGIQLKL